MDGRIYCESITQILESELKVDKPKAGRVTRRSPKTITQVSESKGTKEKVSYDPEGEYSNHNTCEKHREELYRYKSFIDMPDGELLQKFREADRSKAAPLIKELRQYFEQVLKSEGSQFEFVRITEVNVSEAMRFHYYITFLAHTGDDVAETFQALVLVNMLLLGDYRVHFCRLVHKPN